MVSGHISRANPDHAPSLPKDLSHMIFRQSIYRLKAMQKHDMHWHTAEPKQQLATVDIQTLPLPTDSTKQSTSRQHGVDSTEDRASNDIIHSTLIHWTTCLHCQCQDHSTSSEGAPLGAHVGKSAAEPSPVVHGRYFPPTLMTMLERSRGLWPAAAVSRYRTLAQN